MNIKYKINDVISLNELQTFWRDMAKKQYGKLTALELFHYDWRTPEQEQTMIDNSIFITVRNEGVLIGICRIITDKAYVYYICDVAVLPDWQSQGIGKKLMQTTVEYCKQSPFMKIFLSAIPGNEVFYASLGFKPTMCPHMEIKFKEVKPKL